MPGVAGCKVCQLTEIYVLIKNLETHFDLSIKMPKGLEEFVNPRRRGHLNHHSLLFLEFIHKKRART